TEVFSYQAAKEETILRSLLQLQLLIECIEILTPPMLTVKQIGGAEFDLIDDLRGFVRLLTLLMWKRLATTGVGEQAYGALAACIAGLAEKENDAIALIESGYAASHGDAIAFENWFEKSGRKAMEKVETLL